MDILGIVLLTIGGMLTFAAGLGLALSDPDSRVTKAEVADFFFFTGILAFTRQFLSAIWRGIRHRRSPELSLVILLAVGLAMVVAAILAFFFGN